MVKNEDYILNNGVAIPKIGFGTWQISDENQAYEATRWALEAGYRHLDTAYVYANEQSIGRAIKDSGIPRAEIFVTTKLPAEIKSSRECRAYLAASLQNLGLTYVDLYLIHAPWPWNEIGRDCRIGNIEVWKTMIELAHEGQMRAIGVSNFQAADIQNIVDATGVIPQVNQIRYFIGNLEKDVVDYCRRENILIEAYSPLATGQILDDPQIKAIADKYHTSVAKICLNFCLMNGTLPLPKSAQQSRIKDNLDLDFKIEYADMAYLNSLVNEELKKPLRS